jgi:creatinine amidohydrolase/Fe(II)-dependent formamide hydrolase-like protein
LAVHKLGLEGFFTISFHWYDFLRNDRDVLDEWMWHADEAETSVALYLFPELVDMSKAGKGGGQPLVDRRSRHLLITGWLMTSRFNSRKAPQVGGLGGCPPKSPPLQLK